jgi:hypothetical protein
MEKLTLKKETLSMLSRSRAKSLFGGGDICQTEYGQTSCPVKPNQTNDVRIYVQEKIRLSPNSLLPVRQGYPKMASCWIF